MRVSVYLSDDSALDIENFDEETALDLRESLSDPDATWLTFDMDGATVVVNRAHVVRIDFETGN
jgi:hypothetical protein